MQLWTRHLIPFKNWWRLPGASRSWMQPPRCLPKKAFTLTVRAIAGTLLGLLLLQLLGDEVLAGQWEALPDVLTALFFDKVV